MLKSLTTKDILIAIALILLMASTRLVNHPPNFTPIAAIALFGAAYLGRKHLLICLMVTFGSLFVSDICLNHFKYDMPWAESMSIFWPSYLCFALIIAIGYFALKVVNVKNLVLTGLGAAVLFYIISNFAVWAMGGIDQFGVPYEKSFSGLIRCFTNAIPFFRNSLMANVVYMSLLFGAFEWYKGYVKNSALKTQEVD